MRLVKHAPRVAKHSIIRDAEIALVLGPFMNLGRLVVSYTYFIVKGVKKLSTIYAKIPRL